MPKYFFLTAYIVCFLAYQTQAQDLLIKGKVMDAGAPLAEVKVYLKGYETANANTQTDGSFTLALPAKISAQGNIKGFLILPSGVRHTWIYTQELDKFYNIDIKESKAKARKKAEEAEKKGYTEPIAQEKEKEKESESEKKGEKATKISADTSLSALQSKGLFNNLQKSYQDFFTPTTKDSPIDTDIQRIMERLQQEQELTLQRNTAIRQEIQRIAQKLKENPTLPEDEKAKIRIRIQELEAQLKANMEAYQKLREATEIELATLKRLANIQEDFLQQNKTILWALGGIASLLLFSSIFYFFISRIRLKQRNELSSLLKQIEHQQEELKAVNDDLAEKKGEIDKGIDAALRIQQAMLTQADFMQVFGEQNYFIFYKACHGKVSGDFYFMEEKRVELKDGIIHDCLFVVCADCTGHGIEGSLMTMLGNQMLHDILHDSKHKLHEPAKILRRLHSEVRRALNFKATHIPNGMDLSMAVLYKTKENKNDLLTVSKIEFAGAKNGLYYISDQPDAVLQEIKGDRKGVGGYELEDNEGLREYQNQILDLQEGQNYTLYFYSDGFQDQIGGEKNKKFGLPKMREALQKNITQPMKTQAELLENINSQWIIQGKSEQTDDITLIGLRIRKESS